MPYKDKEKSLEYQKKYNELRKTVSREQRKLDREKKKLYDIEYRKLHQEERSKRQKEYFRLHKYGISYDEYQELHIKQHGVCAICGKEETREGFSLHVDHDHITGKIRGLLCFKCNAGIGLFQNSDALLIKAAEYIENNYEEEGG